MKKSDETKVVKNGIRIWKNSLKSVCPTPIHRYGAHRDADVGHTDFNQLRVRCWNKKRAEASCIGSHYQFFKFLLYHKASLFNQLFCSLSMKKCSSISTSPSGSALSFPKERQIRFSISILNESISGLIYVFFIFNTF